MNTYFADPVHNAAFERFVEVLARLMEQYGPLVQEEIDRERAQTEDAA